MVIPWSLPEDLQDDASEPRAAMGKIFKDKVGVNSSVITDCRSQFYPDFIQISMKPQQSVGRSTTLFQIIENYWTVYHEILVHRG